MWGFGLEHEYLIRIPLSDVYPGDSSSNQISSKSGKYGSYTRQAFWVPEEIPFFLYNFVTERDKIEIPMKLVVDYTSFQCVELVTKNPVSRTIGELVGELSSSLETVESTVYSKKFRDFTEKTVKRMKRTAKARRTNNKEWDDIYNQTLKAVNYLHDSVSIVKKNKFDPMGLFRKSGPEPVSPLPSLRFPYGSDVAFSRVHENKQINYPVYTGSIHVNVTLPHDPNESVTDNSEFMIRHLRAAAALQWVQPLMIVVLGSPDPFHSIDKTLFSALSFRHRQENNTGMVSSNLYDKGFVKHRTIYNFRDMIEPDENDKLVDIHSKYHMHDIGHMKLESNVIEPMWMRSMKNNKATEANSFVSKSYECPSLPFMGTDFRRDTKSRSGLFGFEFRSLDTIPVENLACVLRFIWYVFDSSINLPKRKSVLSSPEYNAFESNSFSKFLISASKLGSKAAITKEYSDSLTKVFRLDSDILNGSDNAFEAINKLSDVLYKKFGKGKGNYSRYVDFPDGDKKYYTNVPFIPDINSAALEYHKNLNMKIS
jgi:hypothetical protein